MRAAEPLLFVLSACVSRPAARPVKAWDNQLLPNQAKLSRDLWARAIRPGDTAIDATCGRGKDTLTLAEMTGASGMVVAVDIQPSAIKQSKDYVEKNLSPEKKPTMLWVNESHERFPNDIQAESVSAIVYNLGYLPGDDSDRTIVTKSESTIRSLQAGLELLRRGGLITVTAYIKQEGGPEEEAAVLDMASNLDPKLWTVNYVQWINRELAPSIIAIEKKI
mmetsp:Transcript_17792/g.71676  ORF Transcript_17792/g.71676 Transcript_17792/m.71676 type:complete len:221 (-) Transcript_17792:888-1550(-)|eukprot:CAMPEP_0113958182 /NCGR_PEP_ID=MMETSP0011_2-20120614/3232_1 /TAXON_ID=101924 /ORGANISM="Rhodosorus marinus" /LENGTH=220 /DNA_ID=CAMNT_0000968925 /DNA_START=360 /DNA_END=1022 /DNA_ORIENTATION=+ /assembly_acc=CAM_ASM_000156